MTRSENLLMRVLKADGVAERLPKGLRDEACGWLSENEARVEEERRLAEEEERKAERERARREAADKALCDDLLCRGTWWKNVLRKERFALCRRTVYVWHERGTGKELVKEDEYCAVDLARGYMSPYWGYWKYWGADSGATKFYMEQIKPVLNARNDKELTRLLASDWNFFNVAEDEKFSVVDYTVIDGKVHINGVGPEMTLVEHQKAMEEKYGRGREATPPRDACKK